MANNINELNKHDLREWSSEIEDVLQNLSEKATVWRQLHMKNHEIFKRKYYWFMIPIIVLSSFTGSANLALGSLSTANSNTTTTINLAIGALGIIITLISTLNNVFSYQKRKDDHSRAAKDWYRVNRMISIELALHRSKRHNVDIFFQLVMQEIERIHDTQPNIREDVLKNFLKTYKNKKLDINIPEILSLKKTLIFRDDEFSDKKLDILNDNIHIEIPDSKHSEQHDEKTPIDIKINIEEVKE